MTDVRWPAKALDPQAADLAVPVHDLTDKLDLLKAPTPTDGNTTAGVIGSTVLEVTEQIKKVITWGGGGAAVLGSLGSGWAAVEDNTPLAVTLAGGVAIVLASMIMALAQVMNGDVRGRAAATTEQLRSRALVATAFINAASDQLDRPRRSNGASDGKEQTNRLVIDLATAFALGQPVQITTTHGETGKVTAVKRTETDGLRLTLDTGDEISLSEIQAFSTG